MQTRPLGPGAPAVSAIGFGGMHLSIEGRPSDETTSISVVHSVLDAGITLLDTADVYCLDEDDIGHNERLFAKAVGTWAGARDQLIVDTKAGMTRLGNRWDRDGAAGPAGHGESLHRSRRRPGRRGRVRPGERRRGAGR